MVGLVGVAGVLQLGLGQPCPDRAGLVEGVHHVGEFPSGAGLAHIV